MGDVAGRTPVKTHTNGDVVVAVVDALGVNKASVSAAGALKVEVGVALPTGDNVIGRTKITDGTDVALVSAAGNLMTELGAALPAGNNNIGDVDVATIAAGDNVIGRVKLTDGTNVAAVSVAGNLKVEVAAAIAAGDNLIGRTKISDGTDVLAVNTDGSINVNITDSITGTVKSDEQTSGDVTADQGAVTQVNFNLITNGSVASPLDFIFASTVPMKGVLEAYNGTTAVPIATFILGPAGGTVDKDLSRIGQDPAFQLTGNGTSVRYRLQLTNLDKNDAAPGYATLSWSENP